MPVSLPDIKRSISYKRDGSARVDVPYLQPYLITGDEVATLLPAVARAIALFADACGKPRRAFDARAQEEALRPLCGDYRIARSLAAAILSFYTYRTPTLADVLPAERYERFLEHGYSDPVQLRLAFYDFTNRVGAGFVHADKRDVAMRAFLNERGDSILAAITPAELTGLLYLDAEEEAILERAPDQPEPDAAEVIRRYNAMTLNTLLFVGTQIVLTLRLPQGGLVKDIYRLAKFRYLLCEIERAPTLWADAPVSSEGLWSGPLTMIIAGPDDAFGSATRWGERIARFGRGLLGLLLRYNVEHYDCYATLLINRRPYRLELNRTVAEAITTHGPVEPEDSYDSTVEARFAAEFAALQQQGATAGWLLEHEPAPVVSDTPDGPSVFIPDFAFRRDDTQVFLEIIGFWTAAYLEKKRRKLELLRGRLNLLLAASTDTASNFTDLGYPLLAYTAFPTVTELVTLLNRHFSDWLARSGAIVAQAAALVAQAHERGLLPEADLQAQLGCYTRNELRRAMALVLPARLAETRTAYGSAESPEPLRYIEGIGLISQQYLQRVTDWLAQTAHTPQPLGEAVEHFRADFGIRGSIEPDALFEAAGALIVRDSLFDATIVYNA